jgi:hypothetical protein
MTTDEEKEGERGVAKAAVFLGAVIGAVVFGWLGYRSAPAPTDIQDAYGGPTRMFLGLIFGFVIGGIVGFSFVMGGLVVGDFWARLSATDRGRKVLGRWRSSTTTSERR